MDSGTPGRYGGRRRRAATQGVTGRTGNVVFDGLFVLVVPFSSLRRPFLPSFRLDSPTYTSIYTVFPLSPRLIATSTYLLCYITLTRSLPLSPSTICVIIATHESTIVICESVNPSTLEASTGLGLTMDRRGCMG